MLLLHFYGRHFLGYFPVKAVSSLADLDLGSVGSVEGSQVEVSICQEAALASRMNGPKLTAC